MSENAKSLSEEEKLTKKQEKEAEPVKKTQGQLLQEALGLKPEDIQEVEKKLFISRFLDYFSEETLDFIHKDRSIEQYRNEIENFLESSIQRGREEDKLLKKNFDDKQIMDTVYKMKKQAEDVALKHGFKQPIDKRLRKLSVLTTIPMFILLMVLAIFFIGSITNLIWIFIPLLCVFCMVPQILRGSILRKWYTFKEENKTTFYSENRDDVLVLKNFAGEVLDNNRSRLLDMKVPLQLIKFVLHSRDYENLKLLNQKTIKGTPQYFFSFEYPEGMKEFPIPEILLQSIQKEPLESQKQKPEKNFIVLTELKAKNGIITSYLPSLKVALAEKINEVLNECEFAAAPNSLKEIIPDSGNMPIYCICGEVANFSKFNICNWKNQFKFYLFEGEVCDCGDQIYVLSLMDEAHEIPEELKEIFLS